VLTLMSELGEKGILKFQNAQHFTSWLRLAPNNKRRETWNIGFRELFP